MVLHANSVMRTKRTSAFSISDRSASHRLSGHCSGYHAVPRKSEGRPSVVEIESLAAAGAAKDGAMAANPRRTTNRAVRFIPQFYRHDLILLSIEMTYLLPPKHLSFRLLCCQSNNGRPAENTRRCGEEVHCGHELFLCQ